MIFATAIRIRIRNTKYLSTTNASVYPVFKHRDTLMVSSVATKLATGITLLFWLFYLQLPRYIVTISRDFQYYIASIH
jgi:hypothetical protein